MKCKECGHEIEEEQWEYLSIDGIWHVSNIKDYGNWHNGKINKLNSADKDYDFYTEEREENKWLWRKKKQWKYKNS